MIQTKISSVLANSLVVNTLNQMKEHNSSEGEVLVEAIRKKLGADLDTCLGNQREMRLKE